MYKWPALNEIAYIHKWIKGGEVGFGQSIDKYPGVITEQIIRGVFAFDDGIQAQRREKSERDREKRKAEQARIEAERAR
jgi:hypothetical protein